LEITSIIDEQCAQVAVAANSRKRVLEAVSDLLAEHHPDLSARQLFDELMNRERLGSTAIGEGVAIPHCRIDCNQILGALITLEHSIDYDAIDDQPVDMLFVLVVPREETSAHLELLAALARLFNNPENRRLLRSSGTGNELYQQLVGLFSSEAA
jgi:PTS system nitrogen regulatory IIA component